jgi:lysophospholipase L1-like esterase
MTIGIEKVMIVGAVLAIAAEAGSRWWIRQWSRYYMWPPGQRYKTRQDLRVFPQMEPDARIEINADGERGSEVRGNEEGLFRVLVAGGSSVECLALDQPTSWPGALERLLGSSESLRVLGARKVHVGNVGRSGIAARHLELVFERMLPQYPHLAAIVIMLGGTEIFQWLAAGAPREPSPSPVTASETFASHPEQQFGWKPRQWATAEVARRLHRMSRHPVKERTLAWIVAARQMRVAAKQMRTSVPDPAAVLDRFERHFRQIIERAERHADRVLVVRPPWFEKQYTPEEAARFWHGGMGDAWKQHIDVYYSLKVVNDLMGLIDARAAAIADELGVDLLDLRPLLPPTLENYYDFTHFTPAGSAVVARAVAAAVLKQHTLNGGTASASAVVTRTAPPPAPSPAPPDTRAAQGRQATAASG